MWSTSCQARNTSILGGMTRRSRNDNSCTTGNSFNHVDADTMILVVYIRKLFILPYLAASGAVGIQLEQGWALFSCYMLVLTWLAPRRSLTSFPARAQIPTPSMDAKFCCNNRQHSRQAQDFSLTLCGHCCTKCRLQDNPA